MVLLDWEKPFDKAERQGLLEALDRMGWMTNWKVW